MLNKGSELEDQMLRDTGVAGHSRKRWMLVQHLVNDNGMVTYIENMWKRRLDSMGAGMA